MKQRAIELVKRGFYVLPLRENGKAPSTRFGVKDAQNSEEFVCNTWKESTPYNIGIACFNLLIIDVDVKSGDGLADLKEMEQAFGKLDPRGKVVTPTGGLHLYFRNPNIDIVGQTHIAFQGRKTQIDLRVDNQYVVAPPSVIDGKEYKWEIEPATVDDLTDLPQEWLDFLPKRGMVKSLDQPLLDVKIASEDVRHVQERCWKFLSKDIRPAIQGQGGQNQMFSVMNTIFNGFALSREDGFPVLMKYNEYCQPPWDMNNPADAYWINKKVDQAIETASSRGGILTAKRKDDYLPKLATDFLATHNIDIETLDVGDDDAKNNEKKFVDDIWSDDYMPQNIEEVDTNLIPDKFISIPGFVNDYIQLIQETAYNYNKYTGFSSAIALLSLLIGPHFHFEQTYANLYIIALASSGQGKQYARSLNEHILNSAFKIGLLKSKFVSGEAIEDEIIKHGKVLFQIDECDFLFTSMSQSKEAYQRSMQENLLGLYSSSSGIWIARSKAQGVKQFSEDDKKVYNPFLSLLGTSLPDNYYGSLSRRMAEGGLFARLVIIKALNREILVNNKNNFRTHPLCQKLIDIAKFFFDIKVDPSESSDTAGRFGPVSAIDIPVSPKAREMFSDFALLAGGKVDLLGLDEARRSLLSRANENAKKFAIIYEISRKADLLVNCRNGCNEPDAEQIKALLEIDETVASWAIEFVKNLISVQLIDFDRFFYENDSTKLRKSILDYIRKASLQTKGLVLKQRVHQKFNNNTRKEIYNSIADLEEQGEVELLDIPDKKGNVRSYIHLKR